MFRILAAGCFVMACAVQTPLETGASTIVIHAVLNPSAQDQFVIVQRTLNGVPEAAGVSGATVTVTAPGGVVLTATEDRDTSVVRSASRVPGVTLVYRVSLSQYGIALVPGGTYSLLVRMPTGEMIAGTTTVPNAVQTQPSSGGVPFNPTKDTLRLSWISVIGARSYEVRVHSTANVYAVFADSGAVLPGTLRAIDGTVVFKAGLSHDVTVSAVDSNYYNYYRTNSDPFTGTKVVGNLSGAEGVFGSIVDLVELVLDVATPSARVTNGQRPDEPQ